MNTKEILNNKFGFGSVPYRDSEFNITILLQGYGVFSYVITDPIVFYTNICSNVKEEYKKDILNTQLKTEIQNALLPVIGELSNKGIPYDRLTLHTEEMIQILKKYLQKDWSQNRGIEIRTMVFGNLLPDDTGMEKYDNCRKQEYIPEISPCLAHEWAQHRQMRWNLRLKIRPVQ